MLKIGNPELLEEFVAGGSAAVSLAAARVLPRYIDQVSQDFGIAVYDRMLRDSTVASGIEALKLSVLSEGIRVVPKQTNEGSLEHEIAADLAAFVTRALERLQDSGSTIDEIAGDLLDGLVYGHKLAEVVLAAGEAEDAGRWILKSVRAKSSANVGIVVDALMNFVGVCAAQPAKTGTGPQHGQQVDDPTALPGFVPRQKFVLFRHGGSNGDPRGASLLLSAYNPWLMKTDIVPEFLRYLKQFAVKSVVGKTPPDAIDEPQDDGQGNVLTDGAGRPVMQSPQQKLLAALTAWTNAYALAVPAGTEIDLVGSEGDGAAFLAANAYFDRQITQAILLSARATQEAQHGSKADAQGAQDMMGLRVAAIRRSLASCLTRDLVRPLIELNFGRGALAHAPTIQLARVEQQDRARMIEAYSRAFQSGLAVPSQLRGIHAELSMPVADYEALAAEAEEQAMDRRMASMEGEKLLPEA